MYTIWADNVCIFDDTAPDKTAMALEPKLTLSAGAAGSLTMKLPPGSAGHDTVQRLTATIRVERDGQVIWMGRCLSESRDLWGSRTLFCEGALAFLNDTVPMVTNPTLSSVLSAHNAKVAANRQVACGGSAYGGAAAEADGSTSLDIISSKLVGELGGVLRMRYLYDLTTQTWVPTLDWLANYPTAAGDEQTMEFGGNLLDFTRNWDMSDYATYCYVRGHKDDETGVYAASGWQTLGAGPDSPAALYGRIERFLDYGDLETNEQCVSAAQTYLATQQFAEMTLDITAVDLHMLNPEIKSFDLLERVHVTSRAHGLDSCFAVTGMDIPLDAPENTKYTLGYVNVAYVRRVHTLTQKQQAAEQQLSDRMDSEHAYTEAGLDDARDYADDAASAAQQAAEQTAAQALETVRQGIVASLESMTEGYVFIDYNASGTQGIYITSSPITDASQLNSCQYSWRWTSGGLAHYTYSSMDGIAITHDGKINANMILTGLLLASYIKLYGDMAVYDSSNAAYPSGYIGYGAGHNGYDSTQGIHMYTGFNQEIIVTDYGARMTFGSSSLYVDGNDANANCDMYAVNFYPTSDRNAKKNIEYDPEKYAKLFDLLRPCSFEYRQTDPDIRHTGFIAQDIEEVLADAGLTPEEFGCLRKREIVDPATKETRTEYSLSYNDLVPLCVDQIQRLKQRVKELEA